MIELKGIYYTNTKQNRKTVLVQYDGQLLHVWHLTDPFYRIRSGAQFSIRYNKKKTEKKIKFPDGASIETKNTDALNLLLKKRHKTQISKIKTSFKNNGFICIGTLILLLLWAGWSMMV